MCSLDDVKETTGYEVGSVPPFSWQPTGFRSFVDVALLEYEVVGVGAGIRGHEIIMKFDHLVEACDAIVVNLTDPDKPVSLC
jgi:Cys-tRNA(Pro)/Cys-tRNA(Cys) deacylase